MTRYTEVFGGTTIQPSEVSYSALSIGVDKTLAWPREASISDNLYVTRIIDVTAVNPGVNIMMPPANEASLGETIVWNNVGANDFTVKDNDGNALLTVAPGTIWTLYLRGNDNSAGSWRSYQNGASVSQAQAASLAGNGLVATGGTLSLNTPVTALAVTPTNLTSASRAGVYRWTGGAGTLTFDAAASLGNGWFVEVRNDGSGVWTLDPNAGELINGAATLALQAGQTCFVVCDGVGFYTVGLATSSTGGSSFDFDNVNVAGTGVFTLSGSDLNRVAYKFTGVLTGNRQVVVPNTIQQYWVDNSTTGAFTLEVKTAAVGGVLVTQGQRAILYCDGTTVLDADTAGISTPIAIAQGGTGATTAAGARTNLGSTATGDALYTAASAAAARSTLGSGVIGDPLFTAATAAGARGTIDAAALGTANAFTAAQTVTLTGLTAEMTLVSTDAGAAEAVAADLYRNSASPAPNDLLMSLLWSGNSSTGVKRTMAKTYATVTTTTNGSEVARWTLGVMGATTPGTVGDALLVGPGIQVGPAPTGGDKGVGTGNATAWYKGGNILPLLDVIVSGTTASPGAADHGKTYIPTGAGFTLTLPQLSTVFNGYRVGLQNYCASGTCLANRSSTDTIASSGTTGLTSITLPSAGDMVWFVADVTNSRWLLQGKRTFLSAAQAITTSGLLTLAHSLGVIPLDIDVYLQCTTGEFNYSIGDKIAISRGTDETSGGNSRGQGIVPDATNLNIIYSPVAQVYHYVNKTTNAAVSLTNANWNAFFRATVWN